MSTEKAVEMKAHCPTCDGERSCIKHAEIEKKWDWEDREGHHVNGAATHFLLECKGCETVFYRKSSWNSEDIDYWYDPVHGETCADYIETVITHPVPEAKDRPKWLPSIRKIDEQLENILKEMYDAFDNGSYTLAAIGLRTALDRGTEVLKIDPVLSFEKKLGELHAGGWIGETEKAILEVVTDAGSAAAHRGWMPSNTDLYKLIYALEVFLQRAFIVGQGALDIKKKIPAKPKRRQTSDRTNPKKAL